MPHSFTIWEILHNFNGDYMENNVFNDAAFKYNSKYVKTVDTTKVYYTGNVMHILMVII